MATTTPIIVWILIALNGLAFLFQHPETHLSLEKLALIPSEMDERHHWPRLLTSMFGHANWMHLIFNMFALHRFGTPLEAALGPWHFLAIYLLSGIGANLLYSLSDLESSIGIIGASAGVSGIMAAYFLRFAQTRHMTNWLMYQIVGATLYANTGISYKSHLFGFILGALYYFAFDGEKSSLRLVNGQK